MLVAAYARVSTDRQDREQTIDSQIDALRRAAEQRGWHLAADLICRDDGRTGTTLARPGLDRLRDLVAEGTCAAVLVCSVARQSKPLVQRQSAIHPMVEQRSVGKLVSSPKPPEAGAQRARLYTSLTAGHHNPRMQLMLDDTHSQQ